jgi:hypothetical protein
VDLKIWWSIITEWLFFLAAPTSKSDKGCIEKSLYGSKRLEKLFVGWSVIDKLNSHDFHSIYVLEKNPYVKSNNKE